MATGIYVESPRFQKMTKSKTGKVGRYIRRKTWRTGHLSRVLAPKPGGLGTGRTRVNYATGELVSQIVTKLTYSRGEIEGRVIALPEHALFVHEGTRGPYTIRPKLAPSLVFFWHRKGRVVSLPQVRHPGIPANPFMVKALRRVFKR